MSKKLGKVSFNFLKDFEFEHGVGEYDSKRICIMSGANLATKIAEGKTTLGAVIGIVQLYEELEDLLSVYSPTKKQERRIEKLEELLASIPEESDNVSCVSPTLQDLLILRNDTTEDLTELKKWALAMLPRILGTKGTLKQEFKLEEVSMAARVAAVSQLLRMPARERAQEAIERAKKAIKALEDDEFSYGHGLLGEAESFARDAVDTKSDFDNYCSLDVDARLSVLDAQIEAVLAAVKARKARAKSKAKRK
jgi:hypothetical protein